MNELIKDVEIRKRIAKILVHSCFRNHTNLENIHAGDWVKNKEGEWAKDKDIIVTTKNGTVVPWEKISRISDDEMKQLMIQLTN